MEAIRRWLSVPVKAEKLVPWVKPLREGWLVLVIPHAGDMYQIEVRVAAEEVEFCALPTEARLPELVDVAGLFARLGLKVICD